MKMQTAQLQRAFGPGELELTYLNGPRVSCKVRTRRRLSCPTTAQTKPPDDVWTVCCHFFQGAADPSLERLVPGPYYEWWDAVEMQRPAATGDAAAAVAAEHAASTTTLLTEVQYDGLAESLALVDETIRTQVRSR